MEEMFSMKRTMYSLLIVIVVFAAGYHHVPSVKAQNDEECPGDVLQAWKDATFGLLLRYEEAIAEPPSLRTVATVQALRREFEAIDVPECAVEPEPALFASMLNLTADSIVASQIGENNTAQTLSAQADAQHQTVTSIFAGFVPSSPTTEEAYAEPAVTEITNPADGDTVPRQVNIQGTYNPADIGEDSLWLFVLAPDSRFYPQVNNACSDPATIELREGHPTWRMTAFLGSEDNTDSGASFELYLGTLSPKASQEMLEKFAGWCSDRFLGLSNAELYDDLGFNELGYITVTRQ
jgi:hypothetical protein